MTLNNDYFMKIKNTNMSENRENDILFSKTISAGKRIYYLDVKLNRKGESFLVMTESKKIVSDGEEQTTHFEKHKIFLYREDFTKFTSAMNEVLSFIKEKEADNSTVCKDEDLIKLKIDF